MEPHANDRKAAATNNIATRITKTAVRPNTKCKDDGASITCQVQLTSCTTPIDMHPLGPSGPIDEHSLGPLRPIGKLLRPLRPIDGHRRPVKPDGNLLRPLRPIDRLSLGPLRPLDEIPPHMIEDMMKKRWFQAMCKGWLRLRAISAMAGKVIPCHMNQKNCLHMHKFCTYVQMLVRQYIE